MWVRQAPFFPFARIGPASSWRPKEVWVLSLWCSATFPVFVVSAVGIERPQVPSSFQIPALTQDALPSVSLGFYSEGRALGVGEGPLASCSKCGVLLACLILLPWPTPAPCVCSPPAWTSSEASLGGPLSPLIVWAGAFSALFLNLSPSAFYLTGFPYTFGLLLASTAF